MKYALLFSAALLVSLSEAQPASAQAPLDLVKQSVEAMGGADALRAIKSQIVKGVASHWEPGQSYSVTGEPLSIGDSTFTQSNEFANQTGAITRLDWDRQMRDAGLGRVKYSEIRTPTWGVVIDDKGEARPMSAVRRAASQREASRGAPSLLLQLPRALDNPQSLTTIEDQKLGNQSYPAAVLTDSAPYNFKYIILFDRTTKLPVAVRSREEDHIYGDSNYDMVLSDWKNVGNVKIAHTRRYMLNEHEVQRLTINEITFNVAIPAATFAVPDAVKTAATTPPATSNVPFQWIIRRLFLGRYVDSDAIYFPAGGRFTMQEIAPTVQYIQGAGARNLVVNMKDGLVVFDAPTDNGQSQAAIELMKAKYPGKPIKYLVLTHHHMDHGGGMRAYVAEGATVITSAQNKAFFEQVAKAPHALEPDAQQKAMKPVNVQGVADSFSLKDDTVEINLYNIANPHADGMLLGHVVKENIVWVTDLLNPVGQPARNAGTIAVGNALRKYNITGATIAGGHGGVGKQADFTAQLAAN
jgi:glyoxylase-like metal-dependent hydrolase (beta-lactamase superfamily II)